MSILYQCDECGEEESPIIPTECPKDWGVRFESVYCPKCLAKWQYPLDGIDAEVEREINTMFMG